MIQDQRSNAPSWHAWWAGDQAQVGEFIHGYHSTWLPQGLLGNQQRERLVDTLFNVSRFWTIGLHFNKGLAGADPAVLTQFRGTATHPIAADAFALAIISGEGPPAYLGQTPDDLRDARLNAQRMRQANDALRAIVPTIGSYVSESDYFEPNWQRAHWGDNYPRLLSVKNVYDPENRFYSHHGVGSE
jgi:FAD/FMN-containing dehydrogenase